MSLPVAFFGLLIGVIVWVLLVRRLTAKPWEAPAGPSAPDASTASAQGAAPGESLPLPSARLGLLVLLAVITSLFGLFISAYYMRMGHAHGGGGDWHPFVVPRLLWLNTAMLILSSIGMQWGYGGITRAQPARVRAGLIAGGALALAFIAGQLTAWRQLSTSGYFATSNPAIAFFYLLTAVHGLHLLGGLFVWGKTVVRMARPHVELIDLRLSVELCTVYWHYLLLVWLVLFAVLLST